MSAARVEARPEGLKQIKLREYALRFAFGGMVSVAVGLLGRRFGPVVSGVFLAFPSILPASLTLVVRHDGRRAATEDARGAVLGAVGLAAFGAVVGWAPATWGAAPILALASASWLVVSVALWRLVLARS
jgi:Protein of unknown function (DUF3147)